VDETIERYRQCGFDFVCITDHGVSSEAADRSTAELLVLDGVEADVALGPGRCVHTLAVGLGRAIDPELDYDAKLAAARRQGAFIVLAHPYWSGSPVEGLECDFHAVEVFNDVCEKMNAKGRALVHWEALLAAGHDLYAVAVDDCHWMDRGHFGFGWIMVRAASLTREAVMTALFAGEFYASCGPRIDRIERDGDALHVQSSPCQTISLATLGPYSIREVAAVGETITSATLDVGRMERESVGRPYWLVCRDEQGRFAWTNLLAR
jgi:hypothetical protein